MKAVVTQDPATRNATGGDGGMSLDEHRSPEAPSPDRTVEWDGHEGGRSRHPGAGRVGPDAGGPRSPGRGAGTTAPRAYVIGHLTDVEVGPEIAEYIEKIEATMAPYGGRFLVHGGQLVAHEGTWDGDVVMLEFPDLPSAQEWYISPEYQAILPLRTEYSTSMVAAVEGVSEGYRAADKIRQLLPGQGPVAG